MYVLFIILYFKFYNANTCKFYFKRPVSSYTNRMNIHIVQKYKEYLDRNKYKEYKEYLDYQIIKEYRASFKRMIGDIPLLFGNISIFDLNIFTFNRIVTYV